jgi:hypothetical protein
MAARVPLTLAAALLAGCALDPRSFESLPVEVASRKGPVVCQLYTKETVLWDRSIDRPDSMGVAEADGICLDAGRRWQRGDLPNAPDAET